MAAEFPGWLTALEASERYGIHYNLLRAMVRQGVFTRGVFGPAQVRPPIYVRVAELDAWKAGGVAAVSPVKAAFEAGLHDEPLVNALDGEGR